MAIPVNIEDLLHKRKIESTRIEFKKGWNPDKIYRTICAFANDIDNLGGGYIVVGVEEEDNTGIAKRPVTGVPVEELDKIQREMIGYNNKIDPYYMPRVDVQEVDDKYVLLIWVPAGVNRPYNVRERVTASNQSRLCQNVGTTFFLRFTVLLYFLLLMMLFSDSFGKTLLSSTCSGL